MEDLILKHRPELFTEVYGQDHILYSLEKFNYETLPHAFLLYGPSGCGKTTIARLIASNILCIDNKNQILEIDAATFTSVNDMRALQEDIKYKSFYKTPYKFVILDECHSLSKQAWQSLLKIVEEPPEHVYFCFCTTEFQKVPKTIKTRCRDYQVKELTFKDLREFVEDICRAESYDMPDYAIDEIANNSDGSPRQALVNLSKIVGVSDEENIRDLLLIQNQSKEAIDFCRWIADSGNVGKINSWKNAVNLINNIDPLNPEGCRLIVFSYVSKALLNCTVKEKSLYYLKVLEAFSHPYEQPDKVGELLLSIGQVIFGD